MHFNDYFDDYYDWGLFYNFFLFEVWIVGSILAVVTCSKQKPIYQTGRSSTVHQTEGVVVANTAAESVPEPEEIQQKNFTKIRYETANDIKNEMSLRHADMEVQIVKSSERMQLQQYEPLHSQAQTRKQSNKQSNQDIGQQIMKPAFEKASQLQCQIDNKGDDENKQSVIDVEQNEVQQQPQDIQEVAMQRLTRRPSAPKQTTRTGSKEACDIKQAGIPEPLRRPSIAKQAAVKKVSRDTKLGALLEPPRKEPVVKKTASKEIKALKQAIQREQQRREMNKIQLIQKENQVLIDVEQVAPEPLRQISPTKKILTKNERFLKNAKTLAAQQKEFQQKMNCAKQDETQGPPRQEMPEKLSPDYREASPQDQQRRISKFNTKMKEGDQFMQIPKNPAVKAVNLPHRVLRSPSPGFVKAQSTQKVDQQQRLPDILKQHSVYYDTSGKAKNPANNIK